MRRRGLTVLVGAILVVVLTWLVGTVTVPYVELRPGPTFNTLGKLSNGKDLIEVKDGATSSSAGQLRFVTVTVVDQLSLLDALRGWWLSDDAVIPRELIYPPDQTTEQTEKQNAEDFKQSQSSAETAALTRLGYPITVSVDKITAGLPADGVLKPDDVINAVDGVKVTSSQQLVELVRGKPVGTELKIEIVRDEKPQTVTLKTAAGDDNTSRVGVTPKQVQPHPFTLDIPVDDVGGPSAGLMLALGIIDKLDPKDLTGGKIIAGTGSIDDAGTVGPIGGVPQKLAGAKRDGATYFLTPKDNCAEAVSNAQPGLPLVKVGTLDDALSALATIRAGGTPTLCPGG
jgi:PDZ domain-containing protein